MAGSLPVVPAQLTRVVHRSRVHAACPALRQLDPARRQRRPSATTEPLLRRRVNWLPALSGSGSGAGRRVTLPVISVTSGAVGIHANASIGSVSSTSSPAFIFPSSADQNESGLRLSALASRMA